MSNAVLLTANTAKKPAFLNTREEMTREKEAVSGNAGAKSARPAPAKAAAAGAAGAATAQPVAAPSAAGAAAAPGLAADTVRSEPSTTIPTSSQAAWGAVEKARNELTEITNTYSRLRQVYSLAPFKGQSLFAGILDASRAEVIGTRLSDATRAKYKMEAIASGNEQVILDVRRESGEAKAIWAKQEAGATRTAAPQAVIAQEAEPKPLEAAPQPGAPKAAQGAAAEAPAPEGPAEEAPVADDSVDLIDYLRRRYFWPLANEIYNTARDLYVRRDTKVDSTLAFRSCFEADEDEGFFSAFAKFASTLGTRKEALKHIDRIQGYYFPKVPPHVTGEATRHLLIPDANKNLKALERSHLPELQESYFTVSDDKDSALDTAVFLKDALEVTKAASEMVISTGTTILTGGNPVAEGLVSGLYSGALSLAEQASNSSVAEGEFNKAKRALDASGMDPGSPEYKQALAALEAKRKQSEVSWKKVGIDAGVSLAFSAAPGIGKWVKGSKVGKGIANKAGAFGNWVKNSGIGKKAAALGNRFKESGIGQKLGRLKQGAINLRDTIKRPIDFVKDGITRMAGKAKTAVTDFVGSSWKKLADSKFGKLVSSGISKLRTITPEWMTKTRNFRETWLGKKLVSGYHKAFDRFSYKRLAERDLDNSMQSLLPGFEKGAVTSPEAELIRQEIKETAEKTGKMSTEQIAEQSLKEKEAARLTELAQVEVFERDLTDTLADDLAKARANLFRVAEETQGLPDEIRRPLMEEAKRQWANLEAKAAAKKELQEASEELVRVARETQGLPDEVRKPLLDEAKQKWAEVEAKTAQTDAGRKLAAEMNSEVTEEVQEDLFRAAQHQGSHTKAITDEEAFNNSFFLNQAGRKDDQVKEFLTANGNFQDIADKGLEYAAKSSGKAGISDYGADLLEPLGDKAKEELKKKTNEKVEEKTGIPLKTVTGYLGKAASFVDDPLQFAQDTIKEEYFDEDKLKGMATDTLMHLGEEKEGAGEDE